MKWFRKIATLLSITLAITSCINTINPPEYQNSLNKTYKFRNTYAFKSSCNDPEQGFSLEPCNDYYSLNKVSSPRPGNKIVKKGTTFRVEKIERRAISYITHADILILNGPYKGIHTKLFSDHSFPSNSHLINSQKDIFQKKFDLVFPTYNMAEHSTILVISTLGDRFELINGSNKTQKHYLNLDKPTLNVISRALTQKQFHAYTLAAPNIQDSKENKPWHELIQKLSNTIENKDVNNHTSEMILIRNTPLSSNDIAALHAINHPYQADYIILIVGKPVLFCPDVLSTLSFYPVKLWISMYLFNLKNNRLLEATEEYSEEPYKNFNNVPLCDSMINNQQDNPRQAQLKKWLLYEPGELATGTLPNLINYFHLNMMEYRKYTGNDRP